MCKSWSIRKIMGKMWLVWASGQMGNRIFKRGRRGKMREMARRISMRKIKEKRRKMVKIWWRRSVGVKIALSKRKNKIY
jgi:dihydrodipicolinate reductase